MRRVVSFLAVGLTAGFFAISSPPLTGCTAVLDTSTTQCRTDADCTRFDTAGRTHSCVQNGCVVGAKECERNDECIAKLGDYSICRKTDFKCAKLLTPDCPKVLGRDNWRDDNTVILGSILPILGPDSAAGLPRENAIEIAISDFMQGAQGLPPGGGRANKRPIAVVSCSEGSETEGDDQAPVRSATHLATTVGVPAIIGAAFSGNTQRASAVTIPANVLMISPTATSVVLTTLNDNGLVWRTSPSDVIQVAALLGAMPDIERSTRARWGLAEGEPLRVWVYHKADPYGRGLADALDRGLTLNGKQAIDVANNDFYKRLDYGDPNSNESPPTYAAKIAEMRAAVGAGKPPHVVFLMGTNEVVNDLLLGLDADAIGWSGLDKRPTYLFADGGFVTDLWDKINEDSASKRDSLRKRVVGTVPGTTNVNYNAFVSLYNARYNDGTATAGGNANAYDAFYLLAFALAANADKPVNGANINEALKRMIGPGPTISPGSTRINEAYALLAAGSNIDYDGASGPLDFDVNTGEAIGDILLWCVPKDAGGNAAPGKTTTAFYDSKAGAIAGDLNAAIATACP